MIATERNSIISIFHKVVSSSLRRTIVSVLLVCVCVSVYGQTSCDGWIPDASGVYGNSTYKILCPFGGTNIVNIQNPWGGGYGIYVIFTGDVTYCSLGSGNYEARGGGLLMYMSNFSAENTEVTVTAGGNDHTFIVYHEGGTPSGGGGGGGSSTYVCEGTSTTAYTGGNAFTLGYNYSFTYNSSTSELSVEIDFLDEVTGAAAEANLYDWYSGSEVSKGAMSKVSGQKYSKTLSSVSSGTNFRFVCSMAYAAGGIFKTDISYQAGEECGGGSGSCTPGIFKSGDKVYFKDQSSNFDFNALWKVPSGNVYAYFWNDTENAWSSYGTPVDGDWNAANTIYELTVPGSGKEYTHVIFTRGDAASWDNDWDKTTNQEPCEGKNLFYVSKDKYAAHEYYGSWGNYTPAGKTVYFDARITPDTWTTPYVRIGHGTSNSAWGPMTKVAGTKCLYSQTTSKWISHSDFAIANQAGWTGRHIDQPEQTYSDGGWSGSEYKMTKQTNYQQYAIENDIYICPKATSVLEHECQFYQVTNARSTTSSRIDEYTTALALPQYMVTATGTNCTVTLVEYTNDALTTSQAITNNKVDPTRYVGVTVTPNTGYQFSSVSLTADAYEQHTATAAGVTGKYAILSDCEISATCTPITYNITYKDQGNVAFSGTHDDTGTTHPTTHTYATATTLKSAYKANYAFGGWYENSNCTGSAVTTLGATAYSADITLYAKWIAVTTVAADPSLDNCQMTGLFGLSSYSCQGLDGRCAGTTESISGKNTRHIRGITEGDFFTVDLRNAPSRDYVHFEVFAAESFTFTMQLAGWNSGFVYSGTQNYTTNAASWQSFDVALSAFTNYASCFADAFTGFRLSNLANKEVWFANVYIYTSSNACAAEPAVAPSAPSYSQCQVLSIYSDAYASVGTGFGEWGSGSTKVDRVVGGTNMYKVTLGGTWFGLEINGKIDASKFEYLHMDVWTPLASSFRLSPICYNYSAGGGNEPEQYKTDIATSAGTWTSIDIPVSFFTNLGLTMHGNYQLGFSLCTSTYMWITNIYYYNTASCPSYTPTAGTHHFGTAQRQNVALYSDAGMATGRHANTNKPLAQRLDYYIVDCGEQMLAKAVTNGKFGTGAYDQMVQVWNEGKTAFVENKLSQHNASATVGFQRIGDPAQYMWNGHTTTAPMNIYANFQNQTTGLGYSEFFDYQRGYINNPNSDNTNPTLTSVAKTEETNWFTLTFSGGNDNSGQWFYYIEDTEFDYYKVSLEDTIRVPKVDNGQVFHFKCYAVDFNGNLSAAQDVTVEMPYTSPSTTNLALKRPVTMGVNSSDFVVGEVYTQSNDGSYTTRWGGGDHGDPPMVNYDNEWWYVDLRGYYRLDNIKIWFETACSDNFVLQACETLPATVNDDTQWRTIYTNTTMPNIGLAGENVNIYNVSGSVARYVRIKSYNNPYAGGRWGFSMWEFEVYGTAVVDKDVTAPTITTAEAIGIVNGDELQLHLVAGDGSKYFRITDNQTSETFLLEADGSDHVLMTNKTYEYCVQYSFDIQAMDDAANLSAVTSIAPTIAPPANYNLATGATATAGYEALSALQAVDGSSSTRWGSQGGTNTQHWITVDLKKLYSISTIKLSWETACSKNYYLKASLDGTHFYPVGHYTTVPSTSNNGSVYETYTMESGIEARYLQMYSLENNTIYGTSIWEFEAYGSCASNGTKPIMTFAEIKDILISNSAVSAQINIGAWDNATAFDDLRYKVVYKAGKDATLTNQAATDGVLTLSGLTLGTTYTVWIYAVDGNSNESDNYKVLTFKPQVNLYYLTGDTDGAAGAWEGALANETSAATRRFSTTVNDGIFYYTRTVLNDDQQYRLYFSADGSLTYNAAYWSTENNQTIVGHGSENIEVYAKDKDHFVSNFDELKVYGAAVGAATEGAALTMTYNGDHTFSWEGDVASGTNAFRIIVNNNHSGLTANSRIRIMDTDASWNNSSSWARAKLTFDMTTWTYTWEEAADPTLCSVDGGAGSGMTIAGDAMATTFTEGYTFSVKKGAPGHLLVSASIKENVSTSGAVYLNFHSQSGSRAVYAEVRIIEAGESTMSVTNKDVTIPASVSSDPVLALSVKFEINGTGITGEVRFTDIMYYDVEDGGCVDPTTEYFDIYHHDDVASAPSGARTSFDGGNIVLPIRYFRHFTTKWSTINVPFEVSKVVVYDEDDKVEYPLFPRFHNSTKDVEGYYWLKTFSGEVTLGNFKSAWQQLTVATDNDGMDGGSISDSEEEWLSQHVVPAKNTPYVIRFPYDDYYSTNWVIFYGNAFQTIPSSEDADCASSIALSEGYDYDQVKLQRNNMMKPTSSKTNIYTLNESDGVFYRETTTVPAFEAYVVGTRSVQRKFSRLSTTGENVADTPTSFEFVSKTGDYTGEVYTTTGQRLGTFNDPDALESYLEALPIGIYIVRTGAQINKVLVH